MNNEIKKLMCEAIEYPRPEAIKPYMLPVWNQPFFYKIDRARALTLSYNPTDKGARTNYPHIVAEYKQSGAIETERIYDILYNFKKEDYWRRNYDLIFRELGFQSDEIAHMDVSFFPYESLELCKEYSHLDNSKKFLLNCIDLLKGQLKFIFIDGKKNKDILFFLRKDYRLCQSAKLPINGKNQEYELLIFKHKKLNSFLIYYGCFLYGATTPRTDCVLRIAQFIKQCVDTS